MKWVVLLQVSFMAFLGPFNAAVPNPSLNLLSKFFKEPVEIVTYSTTTAIITGGVSVSSSPPSLQPLVFAGDQCPSLPTHTYCL